MKPTLLTLLVSCLALASSACGTTNPANGSGESVVVTNESECALDNDCDGDVDCMEERAL